jgi:hypothetical protein
MNKNSPFWVAFCSAFIASGLALRVAFNLGLADWAGEFVPRAFLVAQSRWAAVAALAALASAIALIIQKASR